MLQPGTSAAIVWLTGCLGPRGRRWGQHLPDREQTASATARPDGGDRVGQPNPRRSLVLARSGHIHLSTFGREQHQPVAPSI